MTSWPACSPVCLIKSFSLSPSLKTGSLSSVLNAAGLLSYKHADFNKLRWLKASVISLSLVKTASRISSVSFYTPEPPHSSWDRAGVLLRPLEVDAKTKSWVWDGLRGQVAPMHSQEGGGGKKSNASRSVSRELLSVNALRRISSAGNSGLSLDFMGVPTRFCITEE